MSDLLEMSVAAHRGWAVWQELRRLAARVSVSGQVGEIRPRSKVVRRTQRQIYVTRPDNRPLPERVVLSIDVHDVKMT
ncbi:hypothetical protein [Bradyrhizobium sp. Ash2021]|uniref:hypothetical protein n=1 Tax=Bradyrhizobium sp. Ash2021 TaxID=2954771 RepID=UPI002815BD9A|nr:hypothetical protein [Bradyrhizobium sp. Ash2021]WMT73523.1 hypothetical protein NL528_37170 [Bradyrhizobium sp. Ash2021]